MSALTSDLIDRLHAPSFWAELAPQWDLDLGDAPRPYQGPLLAVTTDDLEQQLSLLRREGYLQGSTRWTVDPQPMADLVRRLDQRGIPPVFALVYDAFWIPFFQLHPLIAAVLGGRYHMLSDCWIWNIDPARQGAGWAPHRDRDHRTLLEDGSPKIINIWLPLSQATPLTSCMYILPADRDPLYGTPRENSGGVDLTAIRALPTQPGDYLIWNQAVLHWGSRSSPRAPESRVSIAWEFQRVDVPAYNTPLLPLLQWPSFQDRLRLIAQQILHFAGPGFFARVPEPYMRWAAATLPGYGQRSNGAPAAQASPLSPPLQKPAQPSALQASFTGAPTSLSEPTTITARLPPSRPGVRPGSGAG